MKPIALLLIVMALPAGAAAQALPETPQPTPAQSSANPSPVRVAGQSMWDRIQHLPRGQKIKIQLGSGRWERCEFAGVSEASMYCTSEDESGFVRERQMNRADIADFKLDHDVRNGRIAFAGCVGGAGVAFGILALKNSHGNEGAAAFGGMLGAGTVGLLSGAIASCIAGHCISLPPPQPPAFQIQYNLPLRAMTRHARR